MQADATKCTATCGGDLHCGHSCQHACGACLLATSRTGALQASLSTEHPTPLHVCNIHITCLSKVCTLEGIAPHALWQDDTHAIHAVPEKHILQCTASSVTIWSGLLSCKSTKSCRNMLHLSLPAKTILSTAKHKDLQYHKELMPKQPCMLQAAAEAWHQRLQSHAAATHTCHAARSAAGACCVGMHVARPAMGVPHAPHASACALPSVCTGSARVCAQTCVHPVQSPVCGAVSTR